LLKALAYAAAALIAVLLGLRWRYRLPAKPAEDIPKDESVPPQGPLADLVDKLNLTEPESSAVHPLVRGRNAFAARLMLIDKAVHSIDVQYYIWHRDLTGLWTLERLKIAADRGVAVRLLLDDNGIEGLDDVLTELNAHPRIEVRLYNPFGLRRPRIVNYLFDFVRLNRRMHNKSITFDGALSVTGGRNIGDEYFETGDEPVFVDLDVIAAGEAARAISRDFARYWHSRSAFRLERVLGEPNGETGALARSLAAERTSEEYRRYSAELEDDPVIREIAAGRLDLEPVGARLVSDAPDKTLGSALSGHLMVGQLTDMLEGINQRLDLVSPYFVPGKRGMAEFLGLARRGVRLRVLTNSLEANDVALVHAGYRKYRRKLLEGGIELFELKARSAPSTRRADAGRLGSSGSSLHAKTFAADGRVVFIGSFNFDPRSVWLNTEMGLVIESTEIAQDLRDILESQMTQIAYRVFLDEQGRMRWEDTETGETHATDPGSPASARFALWAIGKLPIEWLL